MENNKLKPIEYISSDETKIYTPRYVSQIQRDSYSSNIYDHAPVRIYERPIKNNTDISGHYNLG